MSPGYWWKSFFRVMEPQAVIIVLIGMPAVVGILKNRAPNGGIGLLAFAGLLVFMVGLYHETVADAQLQIPPDKGVVILIGLVVESVIFRAIEKAARVRVEGVRVEVAAEDLESDHNRLPLSRLGLGDHRRYFIENKMTAL